MFIIFKLCLYFYIVILKFPRLAPKAFEFVKVFQNRKKWPWPAFESGRHCAAGFSKENCSSETYLAGLKIGKTGPGRLSKL
jgi:hypothetical protein